MFISVPARPLAVGTPHELNMATLSARSLGGGARVDITMAPRSLTVARKTETPGM